MKKTRRQDWQGWRTENRIEIQIPFQNVFRDVRLRLGQLLGGEAILNRAGLNQEIIGLTNKNSWKRDDDYTANERRRIFIFKKWEDGIAQIPFQAPKNSGLLMKTKFLIKALL